MIYTTKHFCSLGTTSFAYRETDDVFCSRVDQLIDLHRSPVVLALPWQEIEPRVAHLFVRKAQACRCA